MLNLQAEMGMRTRSEPTSALLNREMERAALDSLLEDVRSGRGRAMVVRGEAVVGKSALLDYAIRAAAGMQVAQAVGMESEIEKGLHQARDQLPRAALASATRRRTRRADSITARASPPALVSCS